MLLRQIGSARDAVKSSVSQGALPCGVPRLKFACVYLMVDQITKMHYVGGTKNFCNRVKLHNYYLKQKTHRYSREFEKAYKQNTLIFFVLQVLPSNTSKEVLLDCEQMWANEFPDRINKYKNVTGKVHLYKASPDARKKMSKAKLGKSLSNEHREN